MKLVIARRFVIRRRCVKKYLISLSLSVLCCYQIKQWGFSSFVIFQRWKQEHRDVWLAGLHSFVEIARACCEQHHSHQVKRCWHWELIRQRAYRSRNLTVRPRCKVLYDGNSNMPSSSSSLTNDENHLLLSGWSRLARRLLYSTLWIDTNVGQTK